MHVGCLEAESGSFWDGDLRLELRAVSIVLVTHGWSWTRSTLGGGPFGGLSKLRACPVPGCWLV
eukprot:189029-Prymnesium_polylepis.1